MKRALRDESGASLVMVLVLVTVIALGVTAVLSLADTSVRTTVELRDQAAAVYDADGAMQTAVNNIRNSDYHNGTGQNCFGGSNILTLNNFSSSGSAAVSCSPDPTRVLIQCPSLSQCNRPGNAILTLGKVSGEDGLHIDQPNSGSSFNVHGIVFSNSNINVTSGSVNTNTRVYARGPCSGTIVSNPAPSCNYGSTANPLGDDPNYAPVISAPPAYRKVPGCTGPVITFEPGYYDDAVGLSDLMAGGGSCKNGVWWFKPGAYYFDFHNSGTNADQALPSGPNAWTVDSGKLVAGTPVNSAGAVLASPPNNPTIPGSCQNPIKDPTATGVQFVFGGDSQFAVKSGQAEICGTYSANKPPIAVYGLKSGTEQTTVANGLTAPQVASSTFTPTTAATVATLENTYAPNSFATFANNTNNAQTGQITLSNYPASIPMGSNLVSAKLRIGHRFTPGQGGNASEDLSTVVTPKNGTPFTVTVPTGSATGQTDVLDITSSLRGFVHDNGFTGLDLTFKSVLKKGTTDLDGVQLDLSYIVPAFRANTGCVTATPYTGTGNASRCALITTVNNSGNQFYVQGTTYAPRAAVDLTLNNVAEQVFRFGVIARSLWVKLTGSFSFAGPVIEVPDDSPGFVFSVYLNVFLCPGANTCAATGTPALRSKVAYVDADPVTPSPGHRQVVVLSWSTPS